MNVRLRQVQAGQSMVETLLVLPLLMLFGLLVLQVLWLAYQQLSLWHASQYALRAGSLNHGDRQQMQRTLAAAMAVTRPQLADAAADDEVWARVAQAVARQQLWGQWASRIVVLRPTAAQLTAAKHRIAVDHGRLRAAGSTAESYRESRQLRLEIWWCVPLHVPLAAPLLAALRQPLQQPVQSFCQARQAFSEQPLWGLSYQLSGPLWSDYYGPEYAATQRP